MMSVIGQKQAFRSGSEPFGAAVMGPEPCRGTAVKGEPGLSVSVGQEPSTAQAACRCAGQRLIGGIALVQASRMLSEASVQSAVSPRL